MQKLPAFTEAEKQQIAETVRYWASAHPRPDEKIKFAGEEPLSPRKMAEAVANPKMELCAYVNYLFAKAIRESGSKTKPALTLAEILAGFRKEADQWVAVKKGPAYKKPKGPGF
jgi:hypothetical protein